MFLDEFLKAQHPAKRALILETVTAANLVLQLGNDGSRAPAVFDCCVLSNTTHSYTRHVSAPQSQPVIHYDSLPMGRLTARSV